LDDYHLITNPAIHEALTYILDHQPPQLKLVITTRVNPPLPVARLRVRKLLTELQAIDLRFTPEEAEIFFQKANLDMDMHSAQTLNERTEGWVASLQLAALSIQGLDKTSIAEFVTAFSGNHQYVIDYLVDEILARQPGEVRDFLQQTSILDRFCAPLCDAVTGQSGSRTIITQLEQANLFIIPLDQFRQWYRYHHLFAAALRIELDLDLDRRNELHLRAARWFEANGYLRDAIKQLVTAQLWSEAGRLIVLAADDALNHFELATLTGWLENIPEVVILENPELALLKARVAFVTGHLNTSLALVKKFDHLTPQQLSTRSWARLVGLRGILAAAQEAPEAHNLIDEALKVTGEDQPFFRQQLLSILGLVQRLEGDTQDATASYREGVQLGRTIGAPAFTMHILHDLSFTLIKQGKLGEVKSLCEAALQEWSDSRGQPLPTTELLKIPLAAVAYEKNELTLALDLASRGRQTQINMGQENHVGMESLQVLILANAGLGNWDTVIQIIQHIKQTPHTWSWLYPHISGIEATLNLRRGNVAAVSSWAEKFQQTFNEKADEIREPQYFTFARYLLVKKRFGEAGQLLSRLETQVRAGGRTSRLITVRILQALTHAALNNQSSARNMLEEAVILASREGHIRRFIDEGPEVYRLLKTLRRDISSFIEVLIQDFELEHREPGAGLVESGKFIHKPPNFMMSEPLTEQELKILQSLANGLSYDNIASQLFISRNTVKWHARNIYGKLGVKDRILGIKRAQELGII
jgi:LuxR family maltose regulon positive regulatory protein